MRGKRRTNRPDVSTTSPGPPEAPNRDTLPEQAQEVIRRLPPITEEGAARVAAAYDRTRAKLAADELAGDDDGR